ncbi:MaoC/PaaZ C-terminal domain-containing protein [Streptomyces sp. NRRL F-5630]|uniref:MaoC/PaaZ C-terminal domain-containing protein n=1 Tax=Streptomyces sp. NRRL F-5630 TaxID=1463864 RepID=UPI003EBC185F
MPLDPARLLAAPPRTRTLTWSARDVLLYHLGVGAPPSRLHWTLESRLRVLPSFAVVAGGQDVLGALDVPGAESVDRTRVLHGTQELILHRPLPAEGAARARTAVTDAYDKGSAAVLGVRTEAADAAGPLWTSRQLLFARGAGGFGGARGPALPRPPRPEGPATAVHRLPLREDAALLYRLSGDMNPLHADPAEAARAGFPRPVLQGLCTYGTALRVLVDTLLDGRPEPVRRYAARFSDVVFPGETLELRVWRTGEGEARAEVAVPDTGRLVLSDAVLEWEGR